MTTPRADRSDADLLAASFLGHPDVLRLAVGADEALVASVVRRSAERDRRAGLRARHAHPPAAVPAPSGAVESWRRELDQLLQADNPRGATLVRAVTACGVDVTTTPAAERAVLEDPLLAEAVVEKLGGRWELGHYRRLHRAARVESGLGAADAPGPRRSVSGLAGASMRGPVDREVLAPVDDLPQVRGRSAFVAQLAGRLRVPGAPPQVLVGASGYGKSTLALAVAAELRATTLPLWIPAPDRSALADGLEQVAIHLGVTASALESTRHVPSDVRLHLLWEAIDAQPHRWLLVLDDAGREAVGHDAWLRRPTSGAVLVTSRHGDAARWGPVADVVRVSRLAPDQGARLLFDAVSRSGGRRLPRRLKGRAREVSELLAGMPLALTSVGTLVGSHGSEPHLDDIVDLLGVGSPTSPTDVVSAVYEVCLRAIDPARQQWCRTVLRLLATFAPDEPLPLHLLHGAPEVHREDGDGLALLARVGLVSPATTSDGTPAIRMHPAVAEQARGDRAVADRAAVLHDRAVVLLQRELEGLDAGAPRDWPAIAALEAHVSEVVESSDVGGADATALALHLVDVMVAALARSGRLAAATTLLDGALHRFHGLGDAHPAMLAARRTRAWLVALDGGGDLPRARALLTRLLHESTAVLGDDSETTLGVKDCLGWVNVEQGMITSGRVLLAEVLQGRRVVLGELHPDTLATRHRLAWIAVQHGEEQEGLAGLRSVLADREALHGAAHLDVYSTRYRLGWALIASNLYEEAERTLLDLRADLVEVLGERHPMTMLVRGRLAGVAVGLNRFDEAERAYLDLLVDQQAVLGASHPRLLNTRHFLALLNQRRGRVFDAEEQLRQVMTARERALGPDHQLSLESRSHHAWALFRCGRDADAHRHLASVLADRSRVLGSRHPDTLLSRHLMGRALLRRGRLPEAERRMLALQQDIAGVLDPDHRTSLGCRVVLATAQGLLGRIEESEAGIRAVLADRRRVLGPDHPETLGARMDLCWVLSHSGRLAESRALCADVLATRRRLLGDTHLATLSTKFRSAHLELQDGRFDAALTLFAELLAELRQTIEGAGMRDVAPRQRDRHPHILRCRLGLVRTLRLQGRLDAAEVMAPLLVDDLVDVQGEDAVNTLRAREESGRLALARGRTGAGFAVLDEVFARRQRVLGATHPDTARTWEGIPRRVR